MRHTSLAILCAIALTAPCWSADTTLAPLSLAEVRQRVDAWIQSHAKSPDAAADAIKSWSESAATTSPDRLLVIALATAGRVDADLARIVRDLEQGDLSRIASVAEYLARPDLDPFLATNLRALAGRTLAERRWYDEALEMFQPVDLSLAIDPAAVLFFRAVAAQGLLKFDAALDALDQLSRTERVPVRYSTTATLMHEELSRLKEKSLAEIARLMSDSERRLDLGRAGERVQGVQERIISDLDELIKKLEAQQSGGGGGGSSSNSNESSNPADDSSVKGATAPGETDKKKFSKEGQWGDLPDKQQAEAKNLINRNFPSHYRQAIETYFKKLANRTTPPEK